MGSNKKQPNPVPAPEAGADHISVTAGKGKMTKEQQMEMLKELIDTGKISPQAVYELMTPPEEEDEDPAELQRRAFEQAQRRRDMEIINAATKGAILVTIYEGHADKMTAIQAETFLNVVYENAPWYAGVIQHRMAQVEQMQNGMGTRPVVTEEEDGGEDGEPTPEELAETRKLETEMMKKPSRPPTAPDVKVEEPEEPNNE